MIFEKPEWFDQWAAYGKKDGFLLSKDAPKYVIDEAIELNAEATEMGNEPMFRFEAN
jgi:hypothetical protein